MFQQTLIIYLVESGDVCIVSPMVTRVDELDAEGVGLELLTGCEVFLTDMLVASVLAGVTVTPGGTAVKAASCVGLKVPVFWISTCE